MIQTSVLIPHLNAQFHLDKGHKTIDQLWNKGNQNFWTHTNLETMIKTPKIIVI